MPQHTRARAGGPANLPPMALTLYGSSNWTSPYVLSVFVSLREKQLPFEMKTVALDQGEQRSAAFAARSLTARVPTLVDDDFPLSESTAIVEYLEDAYPAPKHARVLPAEPHVRARARQVMAWLRSDLMAIREERSSEWVFYPHDQVPAFKALTDEGQRAVGKLMAAVETLVPSDSGSLFGAWCVADTDLAMMLQRLAKTGCPMPARIKAYADAQWLRPAVREFCAQKRPPFRPVA
jgi:glutathione S-transferase